MGIESLRNFAIGQGKFQCKIILQNPLGDKNVGKMLLNHYLVSMYPVKDKQVISMSFFTSVLWSTFKQIARFWNQLACVY